MNDKTSTPAGCIIRVREVMHGEYCLVNGLITVADALRKLQQRQARVLIIDKRDQDDEYGLVLVADIAKRVLARNRAPERVNLYEIMSKPALGVSPDMQVRYCARLFERFGLSLAPVIDNNGTIQGIVSYDSLVLKGLPIK